MDQTTETMSQSKYFLLEVVYNRYFVTATRTMQVSLENALVQLFELQAEPVTFVISHHFYLKE
jgi:hypothetical protein